MISQLHYITQDVAGYTHAQLAEEACRGGANWVQLRIKNQSYEKCKAIALQTKEVCRKYGAKLIINDSVQIAKEIGADGVHLGKNDMPAQHARLILGKNFIIGGTANSIEDIRRLSEMGAVDYVGLGPFRFTSTKQKLSPILGMEGYRQLMQRCQAEGITLPLVAIGGITATDIPPLLECGLHGIAIAGAINLATDKQKATQELLSKLYANTNHCR